MNGLSADEQDRIVDLIVDTHGIGIKRNQFIEIAFDVFEDIPGLEGIDPQQALAIINSMWGKYTMVKQSSAHGSSQPVPSDRVIYNEAIRAGKQTLAEEGSKAAAARVIFSMLKDEPRDVILQAFIDGASITPKGSPTYFYNISRKFKKQSAKQ